MWREGGCEVGKGMSEGDGGREGGRVGQLKKIIRCNIIAIMIFR